MPTTVSVPARAKVYASQYVNPDPAQLPADPQAVFWGQAYHARVIPNSGSGALHQGIPADATTRSSIAMWDPAAQGQSFARAGTEPPWPQSTLENVSWTWNVAYTWDLAAIQAAYGVRLDSTATVTFTLIRSFIESLLFTPGPMTPMLLMWGRRLREPEHGAAPDSGASYGGTPLYYPSTNAWRDPGTTTASTLMGWSATDADVTSPSTYFPGWSTLMDYGNGVPGQVPRIPKLPIAPLGGTYLDPTIGDPFQPAGVVDASVPGDVSVGVVPGAAAYEGRWLMLWVGFQTDQTAVYGGDYSHRTYGFVDLSLTATLTFDAGRRVAPPLWQRQRIGVVDAPEQWTSGLVTPQSSPWQGGIL